MRENHYLVFDKALEQYGINFVKQNLTFGLSNPDTLKQKIIAIKDEHKRILLLYNKYGIKQLKKHTEALWQLIDKLTFTFYFPNPAQHDLFKHAQK
ncbi:26189_t:CDS:2 [Gigaspora margarita]|uniref:26189_t:CDS:1 n=1 Tax=Gigaspora margarita TaxID=4874 RepID=A0ABN7UHE9_GIGMA|nr:26189_t:CDS:2 [Gigaspora margarita]